MYLIVGLGNPENEYSKTRHNMGFDVINKLSEIYNITVNKNKFQGLYGTGIIEDTKVLLLKPQTYMNLSGNCIIEFVNFYKIGFEKILIIYDDLDVKTGTIKIRKSGSSGTHNGMKSVLQQLNTKNIARIRVGTGIQEDIYNLIDYVIKKVNTEEYKKLEYGINTAAKAIPEILKNGLDIAMNKFN